MMGMAEKRKTRKRGRRRRKSEKKEKMKKCVFFLPILKSDA